MLYDWILPFTWLEMWLIGADNKMDLLITCVVYWVYRKLYSEQYYLKVVSVCVLKPLENGKPGQLTLNLLLFSLLGPSMLVSLISNSQCTYKLQFQTATINCHEKNYRLNRCYLKLRVKWSRKRWFKRIKAFILNI